MSKREEIDNKDGRGAEVAAHAAGKRRGGRGFLEKEEDDQPRTPKRVEESKSPEGRKTSNKGISECWEFEGEEEGEEEGERERRGRGRGGGEGKVEEDDGRDGWAGCGSINPQSWC